MSAADDDARRARDIDEFKQRVFSGYDLLHILDIAGVGVGAAMTLVMQAEINATRPEYRDLTFRPDLTVPDVQEALMRLMGSRKPRPGVTQS